LLFSLAARHQIGDQVFSGVDQRWDFSNPVCQNTKVIRIFLLEDFRSAILADIRVAAAYRGTDAGDAATPHHIAALVHQASSDMAAS
jgi:hypothetical protein